MKLFRYRVFGLSVGSLIPLPELLPEPDAAPSNVTIRLGDIPQQDVPTTSGLHVTAHGSILNIPEAGRYLIRNGDEIVVEPALGVTERSVRLYLLGSAFAAILHQRQLLPLHANVIDFDGVAVAFMGHSGAGKSTLANWFRDRGRPVLGDDVCVVHDDAQGVPMAEPGLPRIRLWGDALTASGRDARDYEPSFDDMDKYDVPVANAQALLPLRLGAVYVLEPAQSLTPPAIVPLAGAEAVQALVANTYRGAYLPLFGGTARHLAQCVALSRRVPVFRLRRRWGLDVFAAEAVQIEQHVREAIAR